MKNSKHCSKRTMHYAKWDSKTNIIQEVLFCKILDVDGGVADIQWRFITIPMNNIESSWAKDVCCSYNNNYSRRDSVMEWLHSNPQNNKDQQGILFHSFIVFIKIIIIINGMKHISENSYWFA